MNDYRTDANEHLMLNKEISKLEDKVQHVEKEIIKFKIHLFYFLLFLQIILNPLIKKASELLFP